MSMSHLIILGIIAVIVIPPEKLPEMARQLARILNELKRSADQIMGDLKQEAIFKPDDILDQNIKNKFTEIQNQLNSDVSQINHSIQNVDSHVTEMPELPGLTEAHAHEIKNHDTVKIADSKKNE